MLDRREEAAASMRGCGGVSSNATEASVRGECGKDGWVPCGGVATFSRWFFV